MEPGTLRPNYTNIIAACIVAAGLLGAARIEAQRPVLAPSTATVLSAPANKPLPSPPLSQETVRKQVRDQILAAPSLQTFRYNKVDYKLSDVTINQVSYDAKEDSFCVTFNWVWEPVAVPADNWVQKPAMPADGPRQDSVTLNNNGYNQYTGPVVLSPIVGGTGQNADICVK